MNRRKISCVTVCAKSERKVSFYSTQIASNTWNFEKDVFLCFYERGTKKKILSPHEESNLRPTDSAHWCSTTEPQRLHGERGQLRSSSFNLLWKIFWKIYHFGRYTSWQKQVNLMKYQMLSAWSGLVSVHKNINHRLRELCYVQTL